jgi:putative acetyltransferase
MSDREFTLRRANDEDFDRWVDLYETVAAEGKWIGGEVPVDRERLRRGYADRFMKERESAAILLAESDGQLIGHLGIENYQGVADLGMMVAADWRGRGVGSALMEGAVVWPHNEAARALYRKFGFVDEGVLRRHYRRRSGELWDAIAMGCVLDAVSPGSPFAPAPTD